MIKNNKYLTFKKKLIKKDYKNNEKDKFLKEKIKLKKELEDIIFQNKLKIQEDLNNLNTQKLTIKRKSYIQLPSIQRPSIQLPSIQLPSIQLPSIQLPSIQLLNIYLFISKSVLCVFILPFIKNNFNFKDSMDDMIENMYNCIFTMEFFKKNFNSIILVIDSLGNIFKPYKELKKLFTYKKNNNNKSLEYVIKNCFYSLMSYETLMKIEILIKLYKNKDFLFQGNSIENANDTNYLISGILTLLELVLCSNDNKNHAICNYISPFNYITLYVPYILNSIELSSKLIGLYKNDNIELQNLIEDKGFLNVILTFLCINIDFYNEEKKKEIKKTTEIKKSKYNFFNTIKNTIKNNKIKISAVILGTGALMLGLHLNIKNKQKQETEKKEIEKQEIEKQEIEKQEIEKQEIEKQEIEKELELYQTNENELSKTRITLNKTISESENIIHNIYTDFANDKDKDKELHTFLKDNKLSFKFSRHNNRIKRNKESLEQNLKVSSNNDEQYRKLKEKYNILKLK